MLLLFLALTSPAFGSPMKTPEIKQNPTPKQRYEITLHINGAPGPFDSISGFVDYHVSNEHCVPMTPINGVTIEPQKSVPLALTKIGDNVYKGTLYADQFLDEDYFGLGVCHWDLVAVGINLNIRKLDFSSSMSSDEIKSGQVVSRYFSSRGYREYHGDGLIDIGNARREDFKEEAADAFSAILKAEGHVQ